MFNLSSNHFEPPTIDQKGEAGTENNVLKFPEI